MNVVLQRAGRVQLIPYVGQIILFAGIYFVAAQVSLLLAIPPGYAAAVWPPAGIALAAVLMFGNRIWPGIWIGAVFVSLAIRLSLPEAVLIGTGNMLEALAGAALIQRLIGLPVQFRRGEEVIIFVAVASSCSVIAATIGALAAAVTAPQAWTEVLARWCTWWLGDTSSIIMFAPLILSWSVRDTRVRTWQRKAELTGLALLLLCVAWAVFSARYASLVPNSYLVMPFVLWIAFRFGLRETTTALAALSTIAIWYTRGGHGPFATGSVYESLLLLLIYINILAVIGLVLCAVVGERSRATEELRKEHDELEVLVEQRTAELHQTNRALRDLAAHLQSVREEEQIRIAREIHDELGQVLTGLKLDLTWLAGRLEGDQSPLVDKVKSMSLLIDNTVQSVRKIASGLRPEVLDEGGFTAAIAWQAQEFQLRSGIRCLVDLQTGVPELDGTRSTAMFRIFQELLTNVARHAHATRVEVTVRGNGACLELEVRDNGRGITEEEIYDVGSLGLLGIRERLLPFGGTFEIAGTAGEGTRVRVSIPLVRERAHVASIPLFGGCHDERSEELDASAKRENPHSG